MSTLLDLPRELYDFLRRPTPQSLLIRGPPGSGKTTLGLALLENYPGRKVLISSRVSKDELLRQFPRLGQDGGVTVVDGGQLRETLPRTGSVVRGAQQLLVDAEADPTARGLWLPSPVREALGHLRPEQGALVVIDSWDALIERYLGSRLGSTGGLPDRPELERDLLDLMGQGPLFVALVVEGAAPTNLDYLVNGVLETGWEGGDGRPERWVRLLKLRGVRIDSRQYPFSLEAGRFHCITPLAGSPSPFVARAEPEPDPAPGTVWPGSTDYAQAFGRLGVHRLTFLERDDGVPDVAPRLLVSTAVAHVLRSGGRVGATLPPTVLPEEFHRTYGHVVPRADFVRQVRLLTAARASDLPEDLRPIVLPGLDPHAVGTEPRSPELERFLSEGPADRPGLLVTWLSGIRAVDRTVPPAYTAESLAGITLHYVMHCPIHAIFVGSSADPLTGLLRTMASVRLRLHQRHGRVFLYGEQPVTTSYVLAEGDESVSYRLMRVV